jgi:phage RecT family recombinase
MTSTDLVMREAVDGAVAQFRDPGFEEQVALAVPEGVSPRKMLRVAATAVLENPELARPDLRASLLQATLKAAADGLVPDGRQAAFVIFGGKEPKIVYMAMIGGLRDIAAEHGWAIFTACVYENDGFDPDFENMKANHKPPRLGQDRGPLIGAYAAAQHRDGRRMLEVMDKAEIDKVRATSRSAATGPWKDWYERQAEKTLGRRIFKKLPLDPKDSERIKSVLEASEIADVDALYGEDVSAEPHRQDARAQTVEASTLPPPSPEPGQDGPSGSGTGPDAPGSEAPFEGEEPPPVVDDPVPASEPTFSAGRYAGKTLAEIHAMGKEGVSYLQWAFKNWKQQPLRSALDSFAKDHPDVSA